MPAKFKIPIALLLLLMAAAPASAQYDVVVDSLPAEGNVLTLKEINRSPRRALLWGLIPGGGQVYNRAWWKVPIVYGGLLGLVAVADYNQTQYNRAVTALEARCLGDGNTINIPYARCIPRPSEFPPDLISSQQLVNSRNQFNRSRQQAFFFIIAGYAMQAIEAFTDAHLREFDIGDNLSLHLGPSTTSGPGLGLNLRFE